MMMLHLSFSWGCRWGLRTPAAVMAVVSTSAMYTWGEDNFGRTQRLFGHVSKASMSLCSLPMRARGTNVFILSSHTPI